MQFSPSVPVFKNIVDSQLPLNKQMFKAVQEFIIESKRFEYTH